MLSGLAPARRRLVLGILVLLVAALVALVVVLVPRSGGPAQPPAAQSRPGPVLLIPGYGGSTGALQVLADRLTAAGRDATVVPIPGDGTGPLEDSAAALGTAVAATRARTGADSVDLVGYSAGGVVARLWVADGHAGVVRRVVTLGAPHHGTTIADLAGSVLPADCPAGCQELASGSDLLRRLNAGDETPSGPAWVSVWTTQDRTVTPPDSARLAGALNVTVQSICADAQLGHGDLPRDPLVGALVVRELDAGKPTRPGPGDCSALRAAS